MTKKQLVLDWLLSGRTLTKIQAFNMFSTMSLHGIVDVLRGEGYNIPPAEMRINLDTGTSYGEYYLVKQGEK